MSFESLIDKVRQAETALEASERQAGANWRQFKLSWKDAWTPGRIVSIGLVSGATFVDLDRDGWPDLALAVEWGPVRVFRNNKGKLEDMTSTWGLAERTGWWTSIVGGDFDGDGRMDLAVGNWGRNSMYELYRPSSRDSQTSIPNPVIRAFYGEWNSDGRPL